MTTLNHGWLGNRLKAYCVGLLVTFLLSGCASQPDAYRVSAVTVIGTPVYVALKIPTCVATLAIAAPFSALQGLSAPGENDGLPSDIRPALNAGINDNCGPPYVLPPD